MGINFNRNTQYNYLNPPVNNHEMPDSPTKVNRMGSLSPVDTKLPEQST